MIASRRTEGLVLSWAFVFALLLYFGLATALLGVVVSAVAGGIVRHRKLFVIIFNVAQWTLVYWSAAAALAWSGWAPVFGSDEVFTPRSLLTVLLAIVVYHGVNIVLVSAAVGLLEGRPVWGAITEDAIHYAWTTAAVLALAPVIVVLLEHHWGFLPLLLLPLSLLQQTASMSFDSEHRATRDPLTGLGNRLLLAERFDALRAARRTVAICILDLDGFKQVNDTQGHAVGDEVLRHVSGRLIAGVRSRDLVTRLGGDEFVVLLEVEAADEVLEILDRTVTSLRQPYDVDGAGIVIGASCGVAVLPDHGDSLDVLLRRADEAMYAAKKSDLSVVVAAGQAEAVSHP
ncbi:GGDEF domain-containing protein [Nitriliruptor alkaliphilus]|uniref:GGDEF domain-containing protein n=1 Tax=Nitriliruptor alkaliphilus TaxID=427918 RepID=UPI0006963B17|nr:GGDEF domain-containing protein [Nitriliruptor alkaliphilus]